jgi:NADH-quinone oxidoreductase subunit I
VTECPVWCIELSAHTETVSAGPRGRAVKVLDAFSIDFGLCMYCGICVEVCPFDALEWFPTPVSAAGEPGSLVEGIAELSARRTID